MKVFLCVTERLSESSLCFKKCQYSDLWHRIEATYPFSFSVVCFSRSISSTLPSLLSFNLAFNRLDSSVSFAKMLNERFKPYCYVIIVRCILCRSTYTYRVKFQCCDLGQLERDEKPDENREIATPDILGIQTVSRGDIIGT